MPIDKHARDITLDTYNRVQPNLQKKPMVVADPSAGETSAIKTVLLSSECRCWVDMARLAGIEPATHGLEVRCSIP